MTPTRLASPRGHHVVPSCSLAGFTQSGEADGRLWVTDFTQVKQWPSTAKGSARHHDFYRVRRPGVDPNLIEDWYGKFESDAGPLLKSLYAERRPPTQEEMPLLLEFMATQWSRVPFFRPIMKNVARSALASMYEKALESRETWDALLTRANVKPADPGASYEDAKRSLDARDFTPPTTPEWYLVQAFSAAETAVKEFRKRVWYPAVSPNGNFITGDNPVVLDSKEPGERIGIVNAAIVVYPVTRWLMMLGTKERVTHPPINLKSIAVLNRMVMIASEQVYSTRPDFCWLDRQHKVRTDWKEFDKTRIRYLEPADQPVKKIPPSP